MKAAPGPLVLCIASLRRGGAERVMSLLANHWAGAGLAVTLVTLSPVEAGEYPLDPSIRRIALDLLAPQRGLHRRIGAGLRRIQVLRRTVAALEPRAVISFMDRTNVLVLLATRGLAVPVIVSERTDPRLPRLGRAGDALRWALYRRATAVVAQTRDVADWMLARHGLRAAVIPNPLARTEGAAGIVRQPVCLSIGRMTAEKNHALLIAAFAAVAAEYPDWSLALAGAGPLQATLRTQVEALDLSTRVRFLGEVADVAQPLGEASVFVLSSNYEGFPNALIEAMAAGVAVVSTDCNSGPREIVEDGVDGLLVPVGDLDRLAAALRRLFADAALRQRLGAQARRISERLALPAIAGRWLELIPQPAAAAAA